MAYKTDLLIIVSANAGAPGDITKEARKLLSKYQVGAKFETVQTPPQISKLLKSTNNLPNTVAINGGDGSVIAACKALAGTNTKLLVLPGGTANIVANELNLQVSAVDALERYLRGLLIETKFDIASAGKDSLVTDMHSGWWSKAILETPHGLKKKVGVLAYGLSAVKKLPDARLSTYKLQLDGGRILDTKSYAFFIANHGYQNFLGVPLFKKKHSYGKLQLASINTLSPFRLTVWWAGKLIFKRSFGSAVKTYRASKVTLLKSPRTFLADDREVSISKNYVLEGAATELTIFTNPSTQKRLPFYWLYQRFRNSISRYYERIRNKISGLPDYSYSKVSPKLFVGGQYKPYAYQLFESWGIKAIVNMRNVQNIKAPAGFSILQIRTKDWTPPTIEDLKRGVEFIDLNIQKGDGVYVHCRLGEGRGPSMAAAYLVYKGLTAEEAIETIRTIRPMAKMNRKQRQQLALWQQVCHNEQKST